MKTPENVHHEVLDNGLTLLLRETHLAPVADIQIWANVGSADERAGEAGLAHFHEHMLFKGTERRGVGEVAGEIEGAGGRVNAYTSFDVTVYYATLPSEALSTGLDVLTDALLHSTFDPTEIDREIEVVLEEIRRSEDSPGHVLSDAVFRTHYQQHLYGQPILGPAESVASFNREKVTNFWRRWYTPDNMVVVAAGAFDPRALAEEIKQQFADAKPGGTKRTRKPEPQQDALRTVVLQRPFERVRLDLTWPGARFRDKDATYLDLLAFILGEAESSRLVRRVRESLGFADRIDASSYTPLDPGVFSVNLELDEERAIDALRVTLHEVERVRTESVSREELERARANFLASEHFERESVSGLASKLGNFHVLGGDWRSEEAYFETLHAATAVDLLDAARRYLSPEQLTIGALLPEGDKPSLDAASLQAAVNEGVASCHRIYAPPSRLAAAASADAAARTTKTSTPARASKADDPAIESYVLGNGIQLHVMPRREIPVVAVRAAGLGGLLAEGDADSGLTNFMVSAWLRGTQSRSSADYARTVENLAAEIDGFSGRSSLGLTLDVTTEQLEPGLDLFAEVLLEPGFAPEEIERERRDALAAIERREDHLAQQAFMLFTRTHYQQHPYRLPMTGTRESVNAIDVEKLLAYHERMICGENLAIAVAGDVDPDDVATSLSRRFSGLAAGTSFKSSIPALEPIPDAVRQARIQKDRAQAHLVLGFRGLDVADPDRHVLEVISQLLAGQSGRLFLELRDRRSLAYSVSAMNIEGFAPGFFAVYIATAPEKVEEARTGMLAELETLLAGPPPEDELAQARRNLIGNFAIGQQRNSGHAAHMALDSLYGLGPDASRAFPGAIAAVTGEDVLRVARRVIDLGRYTEALVEP